MCEDPGQDLWWKLVDGYVCVLDDSEYLQNLREAPLDVGDLQTIGSSVTWWSQGLWNADLVGSQLE